ncbi:MAG: hypothetical protein B6I28_04755 [Fusobacteriia bacterium 4572_132]|nr:MAG: hypothetical protein B6I28_04755 [Fusobacteriia bacterium 4572_132]
MDYVGISIEAIKNTAEEMLEKKIDYNFLGEKKSPLELENFAIIVGIAGQVAGQLIFGFNEEVVKLISAQMIGQAVTEMDELALSAIAEFVNVVSGHVTIDLVESGSKKLGMSPPSIIMGRDLKISTKIEPIKEIKMSIENYGEVSIYIALKERKEGGLK